LKDIFVFGQDLNDYSPASKQVIKALRKAGFRRSEYEVLNDPRLLRQAGKCYVLTFGAEAYSEITGRVGIGEGRGELHGSQWSDEALVFPTYSPGYLRRNPRIKNVFENNLADFYAWIKLDKDGIVV
jgi:hypothetical protein